MDASKIKTDITLPQKTARALAATSTTAQDDEYDVEDGLLTLYVLSDKVPLAEGTGLAARLASGRFAQDGTVPLKRAHSTSSKDDKSDEPSAKVRRTATAQSQKKKDDNNFVDDKGKCKYGADCHRKNPEHKVRFWHPPKKASPVADTNPPATTSTNTTQSVNTLTPILQHYVIHIHSSSAPTQQEHHDLTALVRKCGCQRIDSNAQDLLPGATVICTDREAAEVDSNKCLSVY